jgi:hypothetical protein
MNSSSHIYTIDINELAAARRRWQTERAEMETIRFDREECGQRLYEGCPGESCDRPCSATITEHIVSTQRVISAWTFLGWLAVAWLLIAAAGAYGLSRVEAVHVAERV